jgi:hypothetical protein
VAEFLPKSSNVKGRRDKNLGKKREKFKFLGLATVMNLNFIQMKISFLKPSFDIIIK